jgi:hypothetical protein
MLGARRDCGLSIGGGGVRLQIVFTFSTAIAGNPNRRTAAPTGVDGERSSCVRRTSLWEPGLPAMASVSTPPRPTIIPIDNHHRGECLPQKFRQRRINPIKPSPHTGGAHHVDSSPDLPGPDGRNAEHFFLARIVRGATVMIHPVTLSVSFPVFGNNYYSQQVVSRKVFALVFDKQFEDLLMPAAANHFSNEVVGLNDQFRFLNDVLADHLLNRATTAQPARPSQQAQRIVG